MRKPWRATRGEQGRLAFKMAVDRRPGNTWLRTDAAQSQSVDALLANLADGRVDPKRAQGQGDDTSLWASVVP